MAEAWGMSGTQATVGQGVDGRQGYWRVEERVGKTSTEGKGPKKKEKGILAESRGPQSHNWWA